LTKEQQRERRAPAAACPLLPGGRSSAQPMGVAAAVLIW